MTQIGIAEARRKLSQLVDRAAGGENIVIARNGEPIAQLVAVADHPSLSAAHGSLRGRVHFAEDFDTLPDDVAKAFGQS